jgi:hypothetical protein
VIGRTGLVTISSTRPDTEFEKKPPFKVVAGPDVVVRWIFVEGACNELSTHTQYTYPRISPPYMCSDTLLGMPLGLTALVA